MSTHDSKRLPEVLLRHDANGRLKAAFDKVNSLSPTEAYDRTSLGRWLDGVTPSKRGFIKKLGEVLNDPDVLSAWEHDARTKDHILRDILTRFRRLSLDHKRAIWSDLLREFVAANGNSRTDFEMDIELRPASDLKYNQLNVTLSWKGRLPARARVHVILDDYGLEAAYADEQCIFREFVPLKREAFLEASTPLTKSVPVLRYKPTDHNSFIQATNQSPVPGELGLFEFANDHIAMAEIRLSLAVPYPADLPMYPVMLGRYAITGRAKLTMLLATEISGSPHALQFLGTTPAWIQPSDLGRKKLSVEVGIDSSIVEPGSGIIFYWLPNAIIGPEED